MFEEKDRTRYGKVAHYQHHCVFFVSSLLLSCHSPSDVQVAIMELLFLPMFLTLYVCVYHSILLQTSGKLRLVFRVFVCPFFSRDPVLLCVASMYLRSDRSVHVCVDVYLPSCLSFSALCPIISSKTEKITFVFYVRLSSVVCVCM